MLKKVEACYPKSTWLKLSTMYDAFRFITSPACEQHDPSYASELRVKVVSEVRQRLAALCQFLRRTGILRVLATLEPASATFIRSCVVEMRRFEPRSNFIDGERKLRDVKARCRLGPWTKRERLLRSDIDHHAHASNRQVTCHSIWLTSSLTCEGAGLAPFDRRPP